MYLKDDNDLWKKSVNVIYDLEYSGNLKHHLGKECCIWEIAAKSGNHTFHVLVNPYLTHAYVPPPVHERYSMPSEQEFHEKGALPFDIAIELFMVFLQGLLKSEDQHIVLMSHNGFRGDKIVLENEIIRHQLHNKMMTIKLFFFDTLYFIRDKLPDRESYSISNLYRDIFDKEVQDVHTAESDVDALEQILNYVNQPLEGSIFMMFLTPFSNVRGIGKGMQQRFFRAGFTSLEHFFYVVGIDIGNINNALLNHGIMYGDIYKINCIATELYNYGLMKLIL